MQGSSQSFRAISRRAAGVTRQPTHTSKPGLARRHRHLAVRLSLLLATTSLAVCSALAQRTVRDLSGIVSDRHHEPIRGAVVQVHNETTRGVLSFITGRDGAYSFKRLDGAADYSVWATYRDYRSRTRKLSLFDAKQAKTINLVIRMK